ncbi:sigma-54-dependent Fis family transcriptional regulator [Desulfotomaculum copahuensis]|uniref:HTH-type transcriptional regulatory protein TyrR n=1 Tax=Desulfotomaculum copahuensis TaxID=1838280 RepID=A0A1B7LHZ9_9FIRM|nr:sigma-54-dependent Fis family transcriptional regulator [Desulfotomaculum copahuensis]OAT85814.1 hypothetical protein A6M21_04850 [Desulfotomaculum copahuensis]
MKIAPFMTLDPVSLEEGDSIEKAAGVFIQYGIDGAPVVNKAKHVTGIFTKTHIFRALLNHLPSCTPVGRLMNRQVKTISVDMRIDEAWSMAQRHHIGRLPVVDGDGRLVGILTRTDLVRAFEKSSLSAARELHRAMEVYHELNTIIDCSYDGIIVVDERGEIISSNRAYEKLAGQLQHPPGEESLTGLVVQISRQVCAAASPVSLRRRFSGGREVILTGNPVTGLQNRDITRVVVNCRDITELNELHRQLETSRQLTGVYQSELEALRKCDLGHTIVCHSQSMRKCLDLAVRLARVDSTVLISGESGTGKEVVARLIHQAGRRSKAPFIRINCGAIPENLLESELFGYLSGAFTGARREGKPGLLELAHGGTAFLDEVGELPLPLQVKLLTVIQERELTRVGGTRAVPVDIRFLAATNRSLEQMVAAGLFRADLYYRLNVVPLNIPPLRERREEIPFFVAHFVRKFNSKYTFCKKMDQKVIDRLMEYHWPGNVRELENMVERLLVVSPGDSIGLADLPPYYFRCSAAGDGPGREEEMIRRLYFQFRSTRKVAGILGVNQSTVVRKMKKYNIQVRDIICDAK